MISVLTFIYPANTTQSKCWTNVGPPSTTSAQHWSNIGSMYRVCWVALTLDLTYPPPPSCYWQDYDIWLSFVSFMWSKKWNESGFMPPLCTYRLNWARKTSWGWWDVWDDTVLQTQDSKFEPWRSEAEHATSRSRRLPTILTFTRGWGRIHVM